MKLSIDDQFVQVTLEQNQTVTSLLEKLPLSLTMQELNGNEKYKYLPFSLPANAQKVHTVQAGDIMLFQENCLVIFYKTFSTPYTYTKIGHIQDAKMLHALQSTSSIQVKIQ